MAKLKILETKQFWGMCDASAGVLVGREHIVVANDEDNVLRVYDVRRGGRPTQTIDLNSFLGLSPEDESDIESAATIDDTVYWIGSHGRNKKGKEVPSRQLFFATKFIAADAGVNVESIGQPYHRLLDDLIAEPNLQYLGLAAASQLKPKERDGLNIEGLTATREGHLLVGFRNPIPDGKALVVPLLNPSAIVLGKKAVLGEARLLDLNGLGVRDMVRIGSRYIVLAGPYDGQDDSRLFEWDGESKVRELGPLNLGKGRPEALILECEPDRRLFVRTDN